MSYHIERYLEGGRAEEPIAWYIRHAAMQTRYLNLPQEPNMSYHIERYLEGGREDESIAWYIRHAAMQTHLCRKYFNL